MESVTSKLDPFGAEMERKSWPFKEMAVGEVIEIAIDRMQVDAVSNWRKTQHYCHCYGVQNGKRFRTRKIGDTGYIKRVA